MIIIKTKDGDHFINEKEVIEVAHDKNSATVFYYGQNAGSNRIENVESIIYNDEKTDDALTEKEMYDDYQERSTTTNDRGSQLAWAFIILLASMMIGNHSYLEYYVGGACGLAYLLLSMIQSAWQTVAIWIVKNRIKRDTLIIEDYPEWVGGWAWVFWYTKIGLLAIGTIYVAYRFVSPLFNL
jgi:hypothetical protein